MQWVYKDSESIVQTTVDVDVKIPAWPSICYISRIPTFWEHEVMQDFPSLRA